MPASRLQAVIAIASLKLASMNVNMYQDGRKDATNETKTVTGARRSSLTTLRDVCERSADLLIWRKAKRRKRPSAPAAQSNKSSRT
jgi:hypothetical protein